MALRDSMRASAAPYLRPDETVQAVFAGQTISQWLIVWTGFVVFFFVNRYRIVVVTPQRILVLDAGRYSMKKARGMVVELPRSTRLGPTSGVWQAMDLGDQRLYVHRRFFKDITLADGQAAAVA
jgi:hypothetical protein